MPSFNFWSFILSPATKNALCTHFICAKFILNWLIYDKVAMTLSTICKIPFALETFILWIMRMDNKWMKSQTCWFRNWTQSLKIYCCSSYYYSSPINLLPNPSACSWHYYPEVLRCLRKPSWWPRLSSWLSSFHPWLSFLCFLLGCSSKPVEMQQIRFTFTSLLNWNKMQQK